MSLYIYYTLSPWLRNLNTDFTLKVCLFGSVKLTENADPDKYKNLAATAQDLILVQNFHLQMDAWKNGADMSSSWHIDNKNKDILILSDGSTQGLNDTTLTSEGKHRINFTRSNKRSTL